MHAEAWNWLERSVEALGFLPRKVVEFGSKDVNGTPRSLFPSVQVYTGIDIVPGPCVDVVCDAAEWEPDDDYEVAICTEVFEHTDQWPGIIRTAAKSLRPGGVFIATCATDPREPHTARRDAGPPDEDEFYKNVSKDQLIAELHFCGFKMNSMRVLQRGDLHAVAQKR